MYLMVTMCVKSAEVTQLILLPVPIDVMDFNRGIRIKEKSTIRTSSLLLLKQSGYFR